MSVQKANSREVNDYIFMKLVRSDDVDGNKMDGKETIEAYIRNCYENGKGYTWFSTDAIPKGMRKEKVEQYNSLCKTGKKVRMLFAVDKKKKDIDYSATILEVVSGKDCMECPEEPDLIPSEFKKNEEAKIWIKITDIKEETELKADKLEFIKSGLNLKQAISKKRYSFGYVRLIKVPKQGI